MANPPVTIGSFDNVPAPGSPLKADWPQEISTFVTALATGMIGFNIGSAAQSGIAGTYIDLTGCQVAWNAITARRYLVIAWLPAAIQQTANASQRFAIRNAANAVLVADYFDVTATLGVPHFAMTIVSGLSGPQTMKASLLTAAGTVNTIAGFLPILAVVDLGATLPALLEGLEGLPDVPIVAPT